MVFVTNLSDPKIIKLQSLTPVIYEDTFYFVMLGKVPHKKWS